MAFRELHGTSSSEWPGFLRIRNLYVPLVAVAQFVFNLVGEMPCTHNQTPYTLRSQLPDQQLKERRIPDRSERFGRARQDWLQSRPYPADEQNGWHFFESHIQLRRSLRVGIHFECAIRIKADV